MPRLRNDRIVYVDTQLRSTVPRDPNRLTGAHTCTGCQYGTWCRRYGCCWILERTDIHAEKYKPQLLRRGEWTRDQTIHAFQAWQRRHGETPIYRDWQKATLDHPGYTTVKRLFGTWHNAVTAAGLQPRRNQPR